MRPKALVLAAVCALTAIACGGEETVLSRDVRIPDDEGVVTEVSLERIQLDGERTYVLADEVESFTTRSHEVSPLLGWEGKYVHVGLDGGEQVSWVAGIGTVVRDDPPYTLYTGVFSRLDDETGRAVFADGTALEVSDGLRFPQAGSEAVVTIDPERHLVTGLDAP